MRRARPFFAKCVATTLFQSIFVLMLLASIFLNVNYTKFFENQYTKLNLQETTKMSKEDYIHATSQLLLYMNNKEKSIDATALINQETVPVFNEKEVKHMVDVKNLYQGVKKAIIALLIVVFAILSIVYIKYKKSSVKIFKYYRSSLISFIIFSSFIFLMMFLNFDLFWEMFHRLLFTNELWLLDPSVDRMILMYPLELFQALVFRIVGWFVLGMFLLGLSVSVIRKKSSLKN